MKTKIGLQIGMSANALLLISLFITLVILFDKTEFDIILGLFLFMTILQAIMILCYVFMPIRSRTSVVNNNQSNTAPTTRPTGPIDTSKIYLNQGCPKLINIGGL